MFKILLAQSEQGEKAAGQEDGMWVETDHAGLCRTSGELRASPGDV